MTFLFAVFKELKFSYLINLIVEFSLFTYKAMARKRNAKTNSEETDGSCRESSPDGSLLENPINRATINRKCKVTVSDKTTNDSKIKRTPRKKRISESSCDSSVKEVPKRSLPKEDGKEAPDDKKPNTSQQSVNLIENNFQEPTNTASSTKKKCAKTNDEESDRSCRESSSERSVLENPIGNGRRSRFRKSRGKNSDKAANSLEVMSSPKSKHGESTSDSVIKEDAECNIAKPDGETALSNENKIKSHQSSNSIENNPGEPVFNEKEDQTKINSNKYSELLNILGGKEGDIDSFIKQFSLWKQSQSINTGSQLKNKKSLKKSQKPMKSKALLKETPMTKLSNKTVPKKVNKYSNKKSSLLSQDDLNKKRSNSSIPENKIDNTRSSSTLGSEDTGAEVKTGNEDDSIRHSTDTRTEDELSSKETAEDKSDCHKDVCTDVKPGLTQSKGGSKGNSNDNIKRAKKNLNIVSKEEIPKCPSGIDTSLKASHADINKSLNPKSDKSSSKQVKRSNMEDSSATPEIANIILENKSKSENEQIDSDMVKMDDNFTKCGKRKIQGLSEEKISDCSSTVDNYVEVCEINFTESSKNPNDTKPDKSDSNEIKVSNMVDSCPTPEITNMNKIGCVSEDKSKSKNEEINSMKVKSSKDNLITKRGKRKIKELSEEKVPDYPSNVDTHAKVSETNFKENNKNPNNRKPDKSRSIEIDISYKEEPHGFLEKGNIVNEIEKSVSEIEINSKNQDSNNVTVNNPKDNSNATKRGKRNIQELSEEKIPDCLSTIDTQVEVCEMNFEESIKDLSNTKPDQSGSSEIEICHKGNTCIFPERANIINEIEKSVSEIESNSKNQNSKRAMVNNPSDNSNAIKHGNKKIQELSKEELSRRPSSIHIHDQIGETDFKDISKNMINKPDNFTSIDIRVSDTGDSCITSELTYAANEIEVISEGKGNSTSEEIITNSRDNSGVTKRKRKAQEDISDCLNTEISQEDFKGSIKSQINTNCASKEEIKVSRKELSGDGSNSKNEKNNPGIIESLTDSNFTKRRKIQELSEGKMSEVSSDICTQVQVGQMNYKENSKNLNSTKSDNTDSKVIKLACKNAPSILPEITSVVNDEENSVSNDKNNSKDDEINNTIANMGNKDYAHEDDKISEIYIDNLSDFPDSNNLSLETFQENNDNSISDDSRENYRANDSDHILCNNLNISDSFTEESVYDESNNHEIDQSVIDTSLDSIVKGTLPYFKPKSQSCSSLPIIENYSYDEPNYFDDENEEISEDECDTSGVLNLNHSPLIQGDTEGDSVVWKRKRGLSDDNEKSVKRRKCGVTTLGQIFNEGQNDMTTLVPSCNKWNSEETNSFLEELIYSDEDKINNFSDHDVNHKIKNTTSKFNNNIEKLNIVKNKCSYFDKSSEGLRGSINTDNATTPKKKLHKEWKEKKSSSSHKSKHHSKDRDNKDKISSKSKKQIKTKDSSRSKKSSSKLIDKDDYDNSFESMLKKVKKQLKNGQRSILETDLPIVEVSYKGESLHGILGSMDSADFMTSYKLNKEKHRNENILNSSYAQDLLKKSLRPLCPAMLREGSCKNSKSCPKEHKVPTDFFSKKEKHDAWLIAAFILRISDCISECILTAILEFLSKHKAKKKILLVSRHIFESQRNNFHVQKSSWEDIIIALECCGLERWEGMRSVIQFIVDKHLFPNAEVFRQMLKIWNVHGSSFSNTWQIVEPLVAGKIMCLHPLILSKLLGEIIAVEPETKDKANIYRLLVQQLTSLTTDKFNQISFQLLNDFLRKVSQQGLHSEEKHLRDVMKQSYYSPFFPQQSPDRSKPSSLRRCMSMIELPNIDSESTFLVDAVVHEEEKMEAAILRALQCSNYDSVLKVIIASYKKKFINKVLLAAFKYVIDKNSYTIMKNIFIKIKTSSTQYADDINDLVGHIVVTLMLNYVKQYNWKEANNYFHLLEENCVNKYKLKSLLEQNLRPVRLAVVYSEIHYYNRRYKESIGIFISTRIIDPDTTQWAIPGGTDEDFRIISAMIVFLLHELINKNIANIATMLFKAVLEVQSSMTEPINIGNFFEVLLYKLFELTNEYPETAVKLYTRVIEKDNNLTFYGLTYRALIILAYRTQRRSIIKDIFYKAINEYVYPIIEENENVIMLLKSLTEEEIIIYILEWVARYQEKQPISCDHKILIKFKDALLEDYLENKDLGIPAPLREVDQTLPGAFSRLASVLKRLHIKIKQIKKDTFSIDPLSFKSFLNKIKVC